MSTVFMKRRSTPFRPEPFEPVNRHRNSWLCLVCRALGLVYFFGLGLELCGLVNNTTMLWVIEACPLYYFIPFFL